MSRYPGPLPGSWPDGRGAPLALRVLVAIAAAALTMALWVGASAASGRHAADVAPVHAGAPVRITLPTVVVSGRRELAAAAPQQLVAGVTPGCGPTVPASAQ